MQIINLFSKKSGFILFTFLLLNSLLLNAQIRLVEVDPQNDTAIIKNFGTSTVDIANYWFCTLFVYNQLSSFTVVNGSLNLAVGATVELSGLSLNNNDGDMGLYLPGSSGNFGQQSFMVDFMQWGDAGNGRESVANTKGIWTSGEFLAGSGPFYYTGNGTENGASSWAQGTLNTNDEFLNSALTIYPNPVKENITIQELQNVRLKSAVFYDMTGKLITTRNLTNTFTGNISLKNLNSGIYTLKVSDDKGRTITRKIIKQ